MRFADTRRMAGPGMMLTTAALLMSIGLPSFAAEPIEEVDGILSTQIGAPKFVLPNPEQSDGNAEVMANPMLDAIQDEFRNKYSDGDPVDSARLLALIDGSYIDSYDQGDLGGPVSFSNTVFSAAPAQSPQGGVATEQHPQGADSLSQFLASPRGLQALSRMNGDQIEAIASMMEIMRDPAAGQMAGPVSGIPTMAAHDLNAMSPEQLVKVAMASAPQRREITVGDGQDMYLSIWKASQNDEGFFILNENLPGSRIPVAIGDIVGEFGRVTEVAIDPYRGATVSFESGDMIAERDAPRLDDGIPALGDDLEANLIPGDDLSGEIIVSGAPPSRDAQQVQKANPPRPPRRKTQEPG